MVQGPGHDRLRPALPARRVEPEVSDLRLRVPTGGVEAIQRLAGLRVLGLGRLEPPDVRHGRGRNRSLGPDDPDQLAHEGEPAHTRIGSPGSGTAGEVPRAGMLLLQPLQMA